MPSTTHEYRVLKPIKHKGEIVSEGTIKLDRDKHHHLVRRGVLAPVESDTPDKAEGGNGTRGRGRS